MLQKNEMGSTVYLETFGCQMNVADSERADVRLQAAGFNLKYESTSGWKGAEGWYAIPAGAQWTMRAWTIKDPQFVGKWGVHFAFDSDSD